MSALYFPQAITHEATVKQTTGSKRVKSPTFAEAQTGTCQLTPESMTKAYDAFGIEFSEPFLCIVPLEQADWYKVGDRITVAGVKYSVSTLVKIYDQFPEVEHGSFIAQRWAEQTRP